MKQPRRRSRFSALGTGRFRIENPGEGQETGEPPDLDPAQAPLSAEQEVEAAADISLTLPSAPGQAFMTDEPASSEAPSPAFRALTRPRPQDQPPSSVWPILVPLACLVLGVLGGYLLPKTTKQAASNPVPGGFPEDVRLLTPADNDEVDAAYAARRAHKFDEAERRFADLRAKHPAWGEMEVEVGLTILYQGNLDDAQRVLSKAANQGVSPAQANYILGAAYIKGKRYDEAEASFEKATAFDPSRPEFYYLWGECLRDEGKPLEAAEKYRSALSRNSYETSAGLYRLKMWLSEIEADRADSGTGAAEIDAALAQQRPPMEIFFAAAARDLKSDNIKAAANHLLRARRRTDPVVFQIILADPFFASFRTRPELAELFGSATPAARTEAAQAASSPASASTETASRPAPSARASAAPAKNK